MNIETKTVINGSLVEEIFKGGGLVIYEDVMYRENEERFYYFCKGNKVVFTQHIENDYGAHGMYFSGTKFENILKEKGDE